MEMIYRFILILLISILGSCSNLEEIPSVEPPLANFEIKNNICSVPCSIEFENSSLNAEIFSWNFGDGSSQDTSKNPVHVYQNPGTFQVILIAFANYVSDTIEKDITILPFDHNHPIANFSFENDSCGAPCSIEFSNDSQNATEYSWYFGDGNYSSESNPANLYQIPGSYTVMLIASNGEINDTVYKDVNISQISFEKQFLDCEGAGFDLIQLKDGGFAIAGSSGFLARVDKYGNPVWQECGNSIDYKALEQDNFGDLILIHNSSFSTPSLVKFTPNGGLIYSDYLFPITTIASVSATDLAISDNGDYFILGHIDHNKYGGTVPENQFFLINRTPPQSKFDTTYYGTSNGSSSEEIYNIPGAGITFSGFEHQIGSNPDHSILYVINDFDQTTSTRYSFFNIKINKIAPLKDGNFIVLEEQPSKLKLNLWKLELPNIWSLGISIPINDKNYDKIEAQKIVEGEDGVYAGVANISTEGSQEISSGLFFLVNTAGQIIRNEIIGGVESLDGFYSMIPTADGGFAISGMRDGHPVIIKTNSGGDYE